jgi:O-methyltransferase
VAQLALDDIRRTFTKSSSSRFEFWTKCLQTIEADGIAGDVVEAGVWRGGNIMAARVLAPARVCWLYDTFDGMTEPTELDRKPNGYPAINSYRAKTKARKWACVPLAEVRANFSAAELLDDRVLRFIVGPVELTLLDPANLPERIALLRLDTDWHASTKIELEVLFPRLIAGGWLIVDDYFHWQGCRRAVDDYFGRFEPIRIDDAAIALQA